MFAENLFDKYLLPFQESLSVLTLNFGVRINSDLLPKCPSKTAKELCTENPIATAKKVMNIPIKLKNDFTLLPWILAYGTK